MVQSGEAGSSPSAEQRQGLRVGGGAIASLVGGAALVIFLVQNTDDVTIEFLFWEFSGPVWLLTLVAALIGAVVWFGLGVLRRHRRRKERREDRRDSAAIRLPPLSRSIRRFAGEAVSGPGVLVRRRP